MPSPLFERVADILGLPPDRSEKLVRAMIREIRKRAAQGRGVRVPDLGSFVVRDGTLTFDPEPSLARSVNQRFEGLTEEKVALPEIEESAQTGNGPTTITRGFDMGAWDPLETGSDAAESNAGGTEPPDTDEFQAPPDTDEFEAPDTDEFEAPESEEKRTGGDPHEGETTVDGEAALSNGAPDEPDSSTPDAAVPSPSSLRGDEPAIDEEPAMDASEPLSVDDHRQKLDEDHPDDADVYDDDPYDASNFESAPERVEDSATGDDDEEPNIWASESVWELSTVSSSDVDETEASSFDADDKSDDRSEDEDSDYVSYRPPDADEQRAEEEPSRSIFDFDEDDGSESKKEAPKTTKLDASEIQEFENEKKAQQNEDDGTSRGAMTITATALVLLVLIGGWIVLGQQGIVPPPGRTLGLSTGLTEETGSERSGENTAAAASQSTPSDRPADASGSTGETADSPNSGEATNSGASERSETSSSTPQTSASSGFDPVAGGYTIAVASRESESEARALVEQFRRNLADKNLRIDLVVGESGGTTRYRVGVGQFSSRSEATEMRNAMQGRLPDGAWPVPID